MIEHRKEFDAYIRDCKDPKKKAEAVRQKARVETYRRIKAEEKGDPVIDPRKTYKGTVLDNPNGMKLEAGKTYKATIVEEGDKAGDPVPDIYHDGKRMLPGQIETATLPAAYKKHQEGRSKRIKEVRRELKKLSLLSQLEPLTKEQQKRRADLVIELHDMGAI